MYLGGGVGTKPNTTQQFLKENKLDQCINYRITNFMQFLLVYIQKS